MIVPVVPSAVATMVSFVSAVVMIVAAVFAFMSVVVAVTATMVVFFGYHYRNVLVFKFFVVYVAG